MKKIILFNTASASLNLGDYIINESVRRELSKLTDRSFTAEYPTHVPIMHFYQNTKRNKIVDFANNCQYKFIAGTNIIAFNNFRLWPNWNVNIFNYHPYKNSVLVGCGSTPNGRKINFYTKFLYRRILSSNYVHSVRDERTKDALNLIGVRAINTGCATLWGLTREECQEIPKVKAEKVVFTLTDYAQERDKDQILIDVLKKSYKQVIFWPQGSADMEYFNTLINIDGIEVLPPNLESYRNLLAGNSIDFVGTRLHAGIYAMQHRVRSIILIVDNRARDMQETYNINAIERDKIENLEKMIQSDFTTDIKIDEEKINTWKQQFVDYGK